MATIYNSDLSKELIDGAKIQVSKDKVPNQIADKVVPVMEVNPKMLKYVNVIKRASVINATSTTIYTTPTDRDFYLTSAQLSLIKDATSTSATSAIAVTLKGDSTAVNILEISSITLTAQENAVANSYTIPILLERNTTIAVTNSTNVANIRASGCIQGYIDYTSSA